MTMKEFFHELHSSCSICRRICISILFSATVLVIDELDIPSKVSAKPLWVLIILAALGLCCIFMAIDKRIDKLFTLPSINILDQTCVITGFSSVSCLCYSFIRTGTAIWKIIVYASILFFSVLIFVIRALIICKKSKKRTTSNVIDLKKLYEGKQQFNTGLPLLIEDNDSIDYDLLNHEYIVNALYQAIVHCHTEESFAFGLEGPWGSGKTTIINKVKKLIQSNKSNGLVLLDDFDPWLYGNQESMFISLYETILEKTSIKMSKFQSQKLLNALTSTIADTGNAGKILGSILLNQQDGKLNIDTIRNDLKALLKHSAHRYIIFIDNLDRADTDSILFVFKLVATFFDLPNIIYVLSYDKERVCHILDDEKQFGPGYLDKIIQASYQVPLFIHSQRVNIIKPCVLNLLSGLGISEQEQAEYDAVINYIVEKVDNIRSLKRLLNSVFANALIHNAYLSKSDFLAIETIRFYDIELYQYIINHRTLFISLDRHIDPESWIATANTEQFNRMAKEEFDSLFKAKPDCIEILSYLFPTVRNYRSKMDIISRYQSDESYKKYIGKMAICSSKYFDLYFHSSMNHYAASSIFVQDTIKNINSAKPDDVNNIFIQIIKEIPDIYQKEWFEQFELHLDNIILEKREAVAMALIRNWNTIANCHVVLALSARDRAAYIVQQIITNYDEAQFASIINILKEDYSHFLFILRLTSFYRDKEDANHELLWQKELLEETAYKMGLDVMKQGINLFDDKYYIRNNISAFVLLLKRHGTESAIRTDYLNTIVTPNSIYRFLLEIVSTGSQSTSGDDGSRYFYYIHPKNYQLFSISQDTIEQCLVENPVNNKCKQFLVDVYEKYKETPPNQDDHHEYSIFSKEEIVFSDI